jgi:hypothetical protein
MSEAFYRAGYYSKQEDIQKLREWIEEAVSQPSMSRSLRLKGVELLSASMTAEGGYYSTLTDPVPRNVREGVERICPTHSQSYQRNQEAER